MLMEIPVIILLHLYYYNLIKVFSNNQSHLGLAQKTKLQSTMVYLTFWSTLNRLLLKIEQFHLFRLYNCISTTELG